jgi:DNA-binding SARP family transcriptional activator
MIWGLVDDGPQVRLDLSADRKPVSEVRLLGAFRATLAGQHIENRLPGRKGRLLFAVMTLSRPRALTRGELIEILWPRDKPLSADGALSTLLTRVRHAAGEDVVEGRAELQLRLPHDATVDIDVAEASVAAAQGALARGDPARALEHARVASELACEPLLPEFDENVICDRRREFDELAALALELLARAGLACVPEQLPAAKRAARQLVRREPYLESGYALLMRAHGRAGDAAEALRVFERLRVLLRDELGTTPSTIALDIHRQLLSGKVAAGPPRALGASTARRRAAAAMLAPPAVPMADPEVPLPPALARIAQRRFVARADQLEALACRVAETHAGRGGLVLLAGEPGAGKTTLAATFAHRAHADGAMVLYGRCDEHSVVPYQAIAEAVRYRCRTWDGEELPARLAPLGRIVPELSDRVTEEIPDSPATDDDRYRTFEAVTALLTPANGDQPLLLVLDDLHWADRSTLRLLRHLIHGIDVSRLLIVATYRDVELDPQHPLQEMLADLGRQPQVERLAVGGFAEGESAELIEAYLGAPPDAAVLHAWQERTDGHPFFLHELLRNAGRDEIMAPTGVSVPANVRELIERRVYRLGARAAAVLASAAVVGREFSVTMLVGLTGDSGEVIISALEEAVAHGLLVEVPDRVDRFAFGHALIRETLYETGSRARRVRLHQRVGELLARSPHEASAAELAHHFLCAQPVAGHEPAVRYCARAGAVAFAALAYEEAAAHYSRALEALKEAGEDAEAERCQLLLAQGESQWRAGDPGAARTFEQAAASARRRGDAAQLARAALGGRNHESGLPDDGRVAILDEALALLGSGGDVARVRVMGRLSEALHFAGAADRALALSGDAVEEARRLDDDEAMIAALMGRHAALLHVSQVEQRLPVLRGLLELAERSGRDDLAAHARQWTTYALLELGELDAARAEHQEFAALSDRLNQPGYTHVALAWRAMFAQLDGKLGDAERLAIEGVGLAEHVHGLDASALFGGQLFFIRRAQGRLAELVPAIEAFVEANAIPTWRASLTVALGATGETERVRESFELTAAQDFADIPADMWWLTTMILLAQGCAYVRDADRAARLYGLLEPYARRNAQAAFAAHLGSVAHPLGLLAATMGRDDLAAEHLRTALEREGPVAAAPLLARTREEFAHIAPADREGVRDAVR